MKEINVCGDKKIYVFDDLFSFDERDLFYVFMKKSMYRINGGDGAMASYTNQVYSLYSDEDVENMGFYRTKGFEILDKKFGLKSRDKKQIRVNCSNPLEVADTHSDRNGLTLLYYANLKWQLNWSGHTLFLNESLTDIEYTCAYKPGRVVVFDGSIPHMIMLSNFQATENRLTFVVQYK